MVFNLRLFQGSFQAVSTKCQGYFKKVSRVLKGRLNGVSREFSGAFERNSKGISLCLMGL